MKVCPRFAVAIEPDAL